MVEAAESNKPEKSVSASASISLFRLGFTILMTFFFGSALVDQLTPNYYGLRVNFDLNSVLFLIVVIPLGSYLVADAIHSCFHSWGREVRLKNLWTGLTGKFTMTFGLIIPSLSLIALVIMIFMSGNGFSEALHYEPVRLATMLLAFVSMPALNFLTWRALVRNKDAVSVRVYGLLNGIAAGISFVFTALTLNALWQFSSMFVSNFGHFSSGLVSELMRNDPGRFFMSFWIIIPALGVFSFLATPVLSFISALLISGSFWNLPARRSARIAAVHAVVGALVALAIIFVPEIPVYVTKVGYLKATSAEADAGRAGIRLLRAFGSEQELLKVCYDAYHWGRIPQVWELICRSWNLNYGYATDYVSVEQARNVYYRVTGKPFNTVAKPQTWDQWWNSGLNEQGGTIVGGRIKDLHLQESSISGEVDPDSLIGYMEWTFVFKNDSKQPQEARTHIALPFDGVVSRVTLWINGKPCEAAFDKRSLARSAYQSVVAVRRDPVLVTSAGRDRIMMQCFPVPSDGGTMKVRLGITFPLTMESEKQAFMAFPKLVENNFDVANNHQISLTAQKPGSSALTSIKFTPAADQPFKAQATISNEEMLSVKAVITFERDHQRSFAHTFDAKNRRPHVTQQINHVFISRPRKMIVVVDGSGAMKKHAGELVKVLEQLKPLDTDVLFASDEISALSNSEDGAVKLDQALADLPFAPFVGGPDNSTALLKAVDKAAKDNTNTAIVWLHGPQPVLFHSDPDSAVAEFRKHGPNVSFFDVEVEPGPNRLLEVLSDPRYRLSPYAGPRPLPRHGSLPSDMAWLVRWLTNKQDALELLRTRYRSAQKVDPSIESVVSRHLIDLCAADEARWLFNNYDEASAVALASFYRIVTPLTAAVVLETPQQYANFGLDPERGLRPGEKAPVSYKLGFLLGRGGPDQHPIPSPVPNVKGAPSMSIEVPEVVDSREPGTPIRGPSDRQAIEVPQVVDAREPGTPIGGTSSMQAHQNSPSLQPKALALQQMQVQELKASAQPYAMPRPDSNEGDYMYSQESMRGVEDSAPSMNGFVAGSAAAGGGSTAGPIGQDRAEATAIEFPGNQKQNYYSGKNVARDANLFDGGSEQRQAMNTAKSLSKIASKARYAGSDEQRTTTTVITIVGWLLKLGLVLIGLRLIGFGSSKRDVNAATIGYVLALATMAIGVHYLMNVAIALLNA